MTDGEWLREIREQLGMTQRQLAQALQLTEKGGADYVRHMEKGRRRVSGPIRVAVQSMASREAL
jgi:transcriptional regulator with XRE-family HTH domain